MSATIMQHDVLLETPLLATPLLQTKGLTRRFGGLVAVNHVDFTLRQGEIHAILGPNGAGKSTLINLLSGEFPPLRLHRRGEAGHCPQPPVAEAAQARQYPEEAHQPDRGGAAPGGRGLRPRGRGAPAREAAPSHRAQGGGAAAGGRPGVGEGLGEEPRDLPGGPAVPQGAGAQGRRGGQRFWAIPPSGSARTCAS